ncbi:MAG: site-specific integrase [Nitrososphaeraceae archaeon]
MNVSFYLKDSKRDVETTVYAYCYSKTIKHKIYTPIRIKPAQWDTVNQKCRKSFPNSSEANTLLGRIANAIEQTHLLFLSTGKTLTKEDLKNTVDDILDRKPKESKSLTIYDYYEKWIESCKKFKTSSTITVYRSTLKHLKGFAQSGPYRIDFELLDHNFYERFCHYLLSDLDQNNNTIGKYIKTLKTFLTWAYDSGINRKQDYKRWKVLRHDIEVVYLTRNEINSLISLDLAFNPWLEETRDIFIFECETGLRFSDLKALRKENISQDYISFLTKKTSDLLRVPLSPNAKYILNKYSHLTDIALPVKSNQKTNSNLKLISQLAGLNTPTLVTDIRGGKKVHVSKQKYEIISTHTARRTFVTLALENKVRPETVMAITGHKDFRTMKKYIKLTDEVIKNELDVHWAKQGALLKLG